MGEKCLERENYKTAGPFTPRHRIKTTTAMVDEAILEGSDPTFFCVYLPSQAPYCYARMVGHRSSPLPSLQLSASPLPRDRTVPATPREKSLQFPAHKWDKGELACLLQVNRRIRLMLALLSQAALHV